MGRRSLCPAGNLLVAVVSITLGELVCRGPHDREASLFSYYQGPLKGRAGFLRDIGLNGFKGESRV